MSWLIKTEGVTNDAVAMGEVASEPVVPVEVPVGNYGDGEIEWADQTQSTTQQKMFESNYINLYKTDIKNISGGLWYNYSCLNHELSSSFLKDFLEPTICCIGAVGILITMVVLTRKHMCTSCNCYLTALAVGDLLFLLILLSRTLLDRLVDCSFHLSGEYMIFNVYSIILQDICLNLTIGVTVMLAVERYIAVCHPMRTIGMCTIKRARIIIVTLFVVSFILRSPKFLDIEVRLVKTLTGEKILAVTSAYLYNDQVYTYVVTVGILTILPLLTLLILNVRIIQELRQSSRYLQCYLAADCRVRSVVSSEELKITFMLIGVVLAFFICHVPYMIYSILMALMDYSTGIFDDDTRSIETKYFQHVCHSLLALRSSCNFILYCWFSEKFWATFKRLFCIAAYNAKQSSIRSKRYNQQGQHVRFSSHACLHRSSFVNTRDTTC